MNISKEIPVFITTRQLEVFAAELERKIASEHNPYCSMCYGDMLADVRDELDRRKSERYNIK